MCRGYHSAPPLHPSGYSPQAPLAHEDGRHLNGRLQAVVSAVGRDLGDGFGPVWIQHQSTINHGNSGGPLLDMDGNVVGVNTLSMDHLSSGESVQGIFFAIPADLAQSVAAKLIGQLQGTSATALHVTQPRASRFK